MFEGAVLNQRYRLLNRLGEGGMAVVFRAEDLLLGRAVAVKALREDLARDESFLARFKAEARAAANLSHPNIAAIYDVGFDAGRHFIVMEYVEGPTLKDLIRQGAPFPVGYAVDVAAQMLAALEHAHQKGLIHRDVKPQNVLMSSDGRVKVVDFGIARQLAAAATTQTGEVLGTAFYLAPERARGEEVGAAADVYAVGVVLYEMLTGRLPFTGDSAIDVALKHVQEPPLPPRRLNPSIPPQLEGVVLHSLAKDQAERFPSAGAMRQSLLAYAQHAAEATTSIGAIRRPPPGAAPTRAAGLGPATARAAERQSGFRWTTAALALATIVLLALLVPVGYLFYTVFLAPTFDDRPTASPVAVVAASATATETSTATATATATPTVAATATATPLPTATPTPRYPAWMRFPVVEQRRVLEKDAKRRLDEVRGQILDRNGNRVPGLIVKIESAGWSGAVRPREGIDQADGTFRFDQLNPGRYRLTVFDGSGQQISATAEDLVTDDVDSNFKGYVIWNVTFREAPN